MDVTKKNIYHIYICSTLPFFEADIEHVLHIWTIRSSSIIEKIQENYKIFS